MPVIEFLIRIRRLTSVQRFNTSRRLHNQSVSDHLTSGSFIIIALAKLLEFSDAERLEALERWLLHDTEEIEVSDIPHPVKKMIASYPGGLDALTGCEKSIFSDLVADLPLRLATHFTSMWGSEEHTEGRVRFLVSFVDMYELLLFCSEEVALGNSGFSPIYRYALQYLRNKCDGPHGDSPFSQTAKDRTYYSSLLDESVLSNPDKVLGLLTASVARSDSNRS